MLLLMVGKFWGAVGVALANVLSSARHTGPTFEALAQGVVSGAGPYVGLQLGNHMLGIDRELMLLRAYHLPLLALLTSLSSGLMSNAVFLLEGRLSLTQLPSGIATSTFRDFAGCLIVVLAVYVIAKLFRGVTGRN